ncbi:hypothetical protein AB0F80_29350, partial [Micromonospora echinofusca]
WSICCLTWSLALIDLQPPPTRADLQEQVGKGSMRPSRTAPARPIRVTASPNGRSPRQAPAPVRKLARPAPAPGSRRDSADHPAGHRYAGEQICHAAGLLEWLAARGRALADCRQADVDAWAVEHSDSDRVTARAFLQWSTANRLSPRFELSAAEGPAAAALPEHDRTATNRESRWLSPVTAPADRSSPAPYPR